MAFLRKNQLWLFFIITLVFAFSMAAVSLASQNEGISILIPLSPSIIAIIMTAIFSGRAGLRELFIGLSPRFPLRWLTISLLLIPILASLAILIQMLFGGPELSLLSLNIGNLIGGSLLVPLGEEFGWRGFALPRLLKKYNALTASLILGVIWGGWHYAGHLVGAGVEGISFFYLFVWIFGATILFTWIFNHTRNIWTMILLHSVANATFNLIPITPVNTGGTATFYTFIGLVWLLALIVILRREPQTLSKGEKMNKILHNTTMIVLFLVTALVLAACGTLQKEQVEPAVLATERQTAPEHPESDEPTLAPVPEETAVSPTPMPAIAEPTPTTNAVQNSGGNEIVVLPGCFDFDQGVTLAPPDPNCDFNLLPGPDSGTIEIYPIAPAALAYGGVFPDAPTFAQCADNDAFSTEPELVAPLAAMYVCYRTGENRIGYVHFTDADLEQAYTVTLEWLTFSSEQSSSSIPEEIDLAYQNSTFGLTIPVPCFTGGNSLRFESRYTGSNFDDFLAEEGILAEVSARAVKRLLAVQLEEIMAETEMTKSGLAERLQTSRSQVDRLLDPENTSVTLESLEKLARAVGRQLRVEFA